MNQLDSVVLKSARKRKRPFILRLPTYVDGQIDSKALFEKIRNGMPKNPTASELHFNPYCVFWRQFNPYSFFGAFFILQDPESTDDERCEAADRLEREIAFEGRLRMSECCL